MLDDNDNEEREEENEEEEVNEEESELILWYDRYYYFLNIEGPVPHYPPLEVVLYYNNVYIPTNEELYPSVRKLANEHYPLISKETRPEILAAIDANAKTICQTFLMELYRLLKYIKNGANLREAYPTFDTMAEFKHVETYIRRDIFDEVEGLSDKQKKQLYQLALKKFPDSYNYKDQRRYEFIDMLHSIVFKHCPDILDFDEDAWTLYNYYMRLEHVGFRMTFEFFHSFIDCELPIEDLLLDNAEIHDKVQRIYDERWKNKKIQ